jgi:hypothetical protein
MSRARPAGLRAHPPRPWPCQLQALPFVSDGPAPPAALSLRGRLKLALKRTLSPGAKRWLKRSLDGLLARARPPAAAGVPGAPAELVPGCLSAGDRVRVRSRPEVEATLDQWGELNHCGFMEAMWPHCGTVQRVFKPVRRFIDERDYRARQASGLVLLEGLTCSGTPLLGPCDRACFFFWREEWLEKVD